MKANMLKIVEAMERCSHADELGGNCSEGCRYGKISNCRETLERDLVSVTLLLDGENQDLKRRLYDMSRKDKV